MIQVVEVIVRWALWSQIKGNCDWTSVNSAFAMAFVVVISFECKAMKLLKYEWTKVVG